MADSRRKLERAFELLEAAGHWDRRAWQVLNHWPAYGWNLPRDRDGRRYIDDEHAPGTRVPEGMVYVFVAGAERWDVYAADAVPQDAEFVYRSAIDMRHDQVRAIRDELFPILGELAAAGALPPSPEAPDAWRDLRLRDPDRDLLPLDLVEPCRLALHAALEQRAVAAVPHDFVRLHTDAAVLTLGGSRIEIGGEVSVWLAGLAWETRGRGMTWPQVMKARHSWEARGTKLLGNELDNLKRVGRALAGKIEAATGTRMLDTAGGLVLNVDPGQ